jgi:phosphoribosylformylglycinamidine synthase
MCFANPQGGLDVRLDKLHNADVIKLLFSENPGVLIQVKHHHLVEKILNDYEIGFAIVARPIEERKLLVSKDNFAHEFDIDKLSDVWFESSYLLDRKQSGEVCAKARFENYKKQPLQFHFAASFTGRFSQYGITPYRENNRSGIKAAVIREQGTNSEREMAYSLYLAGFDVKDVHMTDLISGRETLEDINLIVFCGGFSNSDVLGSAKGWAGSFMFNEQAKTTLKNFYARPDTLSLGVCNGCQLMMELDLVYPGRTQKPHMAHNTSHKYESSFVSVEIPENQSVMFGSLSGSKLGVWISHGEGRFVLPESETAYNIVGKYIYDEYPGNPNGSDYNTAAVCSADGRHLAMMPHLERSLFPWQCAYYPYEQLKNDVTPWIEAFVNAREWIKERV